MLESIGRHRSVGTLLTYTPLAASLSVLPSHRVVHDAVLQSGTLSFAPGETSKTFSVQIKDDNIYEGAENFGITLSNLSGGAVLSGPATATVTINDNEQRPFASVSDVKVTEGNTGTTDAQNLAHGQLRFAAGSLADIAPLALTDLAGSASLDLALSDGGGRQSIRLAGKGTGLRAAGTAILNFDLRADGDDEREPQAESGDRGKQSGGGHRVTVGGPTF